MQKGILVGTFNEDDLKHGRDKAAIKKTQEATGKMYLNTEFVKKGKEIVGLRIWVCDFADCADFH